MIFEDRVESYILRAFRREIGGSTSSDTHSIQGAGFLEQNNSFSTEKISQPFTNMLVGVALGFSFSLSGFVVYLMSQQQSRNEEIILALLDKISSATNDSAYQASLASYDKYTSLARNGFTNSPAVDDAMGFAPEGNINAEQEGVVATNTQGEIFNNQPMITNLTGMQTSEKSTTKKNTTDKVLSSRFPSVEDEPELFSKLKLYNINGHLYSSSPDDSFFMANNKLFSIGEYLDKEESILLTKITEKGIEVSFENKNYFFDLREYIRRI